MVVVVLKEFMVLKELSLLLKARNIFFAVNIVRKGVLMNLESVGRDSLKLGQSGVDKALRPVDNTVSNHLS